MTFPLDRLIELMQKPVFWATVTAIFASLVNLLMFLINRKTFNLLYEKPRINIRAISVIPKHQGAGGAGMVPDGAHIDMEVINSSSFQNLILSRKVSFFPFLSPALQNKTNLEIPPFSKLRFPQTIESAPFDKHKNKLAKIALTDIKGRKIIKYCFIKNC